ncbi:methylated-DNA--[protein]-cysteine S-methyltransferase [Halalkalibacter urbisdiaboli]|uniref:methylated-DNA--[protein]-cysteine S-methyltransferase n=1 Tax=Halalkalibacter urbisdiaboli TaxID=1960589 RepID=UPI000B44D5D3|nr:methylated-DNA--[protein]-cysteine S-methyltransferase [Halalkalibacter urbisdiaboli]
MTTQYFFVDEMDSPLGTLTIVATDHGVCHIHFGSLQKCTATLKAKLKKQGMKGELIRCNHTVTPVKQQLTEYFNGQRFSFDVPIDLYGTAFQKKVWEALRKIGYGETRSYKQVAQEIGAPKAVRAIGGANNQNPIPIIIPCHRVIGSNGAMVGYGGGLDKKEQLLSLEGAIEKIS